MTSHLDPVDTETVAAALLALASSINGRADPLEAAVVMDGIADVAAELVHVLMDDYMGRRSHTSWPVVARAFDVSRQAALKRFGGR